MNASPSNTSGRSLEQRLADLEHKVAALESGSQSTSATSSPASATPSSSPEAESAAPTDTPSPASTASPTAGDDTFWALNGLIDHAGNEGGVVYTGHTTPPGASAPVSWQMGLPSAALEDLTFAEAAPALAALGHPVRLELLQAVYEGTTTVAQLGEDERFGTTGQIYHHIHALAGAGWLENSRRGHWRVPAQKVIPLLTLILIGTH